MVHTHTHPHAISAAQGDSLSSKWVLCMDGGGYLLWIYFQ